ncbi:hypothetical protein [Nocardia macrotermitis]|uniref:Uncharacterized protein n=1 Tax=Nocardia macrotermitis TaxID=2585198 RepID=A0A7K0CX22_9NOCA|nr:hypothetical protein [Nocardia macrotermitis]MQY17971.1 hypothetical protein [Nocardia macrotermitis]
MPRVVTALATGLVGGGFSIVIPVAIWPGEAKLTAPLFCSPPTPTPMVVSDTFHDSDGTSTNYTLYCVGDHGTLTNEGFALPMLVMLTAHILIVTALVLLIRSRSRTTPTPTTP